MFEDIIGHARVTEMLMREARRPANSYLFVGPSSIGKATVATEFARMLLCPDSGDHAEDCRSCRRIRSGNHPDLIEIVLQGRQSIGVEQARNIVQTATMMPVESTIKVFLVPEAGMLTEQAANVLLKTLEEPTGSTIFLLATEAETDLPATVNSRCRTIHMGRVPSESIAQHLTGIGIEDDRATALARVSGGRPGVAIGLITDTEIDAFRNNWLKLPTRLSERPGEAAMLATEAESWVAPLAARAVSDTELSKDERQREERRTTLALMESGLEILATWYADAAAIQYGAPLRNTDLSLADLTAISPKRAVRNTELILEAIADLNANLRRHLLLTNLFTNLASR
jgi:DNA polymerase III delta' subunit